jgi:hypothetical protein
MGKCGFARNRMECLALSRIEHSAAMGFLANKGNLPFIPPMPSNAETTAQIVPEWVPPIDNLNHPEGGFGELIEFSDRDIRLIQCSLPPGTDPERAALLSSFLCEWARVDLRRHFADRTPLPDLARRRERLKKVAKRAADLVEALDEMEGLDRWDLVNQLGLAEGLGLLGAYGHEENKRRIDEWRYLTATMATAAAQPQWKPSRGQPRNRIAQLVLMDVAALFEFVTGRRPARNVAREGSDTGKETGPFLEFAGAIWPLIFGEGDLGLRSQLKNWAKDGRKSSRLVANIVSRGQIWGINPKK